jgi:hypothetical protein
MNPSHTGAASHGDGRTMGSSSITAPAAMLIQASRRKGCARIQPAVSRRAAIADRATSSAVMRIAGQMVAKAQA